MSFAQQIQQIIAERRPLVENIKEVQNQLRTLVVALQEVMAQRAQLLALEEPALSGRLKDIDLESLQIKIAAELEALEKLKSRFARETLNLGVIGRARQGKSRMLQSLSGLSAREIPDGDQQHCTGVRSKICHNPDQQPYAEVTFYTEREFLDEIVAPYYHHLHLGVPPLTLDLLRVSPLPPGGSQADQAVPGAERAHLEEIVQSLPKYRHWLNTSLPHRIDLSEVRQFVAQDTLAGERTYDYLAVREVKIICIFPHADIGQIALIDMPGLGDTGIGDQERLVKALGEEVDIVLFVRKPDPMGDSWMDVDIQLYDLARSALLDIPLEQWSFMILNKLDPAAGKGDNTTNCRNLEATIFSKGHISVAECLTVNCSQPGEVNTLILQKTLNHLTRQMHMLDQQYTKARRDQIAALKQAVDAQLAKAAQVFGKQTASPNLSPVLQSNFKAIWTNITRGLEGLLRSLATKRTEVNPLLEGQDKLVIDVCRADSRIPTLEQIDDLRDVEGGYGLAYEEYLQRVRTHLTSHFLQLDHVLKKVSLEAKGQVAEVLREQGGLKSLSTATGAEFLQEISELLLTASDDLQLLATANFTPTTLQHLKKGFYILTTFDLSYRGFIQYRLRRKLDWLVGDETELKLQPGPTAENVLSYLQTAHERTISLVARPLTTWLLEASEAVFAVVEEFVDQILRAEESEAEWFNFYSVMQAEVWPDDFKKPEEHVHLRNRWQASVAQAQQANQSVVF